MCAASMRQKVEKPYYINYSCLATEHVVEHAGINQIGTLFESNNFIQSKSQLDVK